MADNRQLRERLLAIEEQVADGRAFLDEPSTNGFHRLGLRVPVVRSLLKQGFSALEGLNLSEQLATWHHAYQNTRIYEVGSLAIYAHQYRELSRAEFDKLRQWVRRCDCWEHSDDLSKVYAQVFEAEPDWVLPWYQKWNRSKNPWERRQSVVGLLEYAQKRKAVQPFKTLLGFVTPLLNDDEYYVQKGVGWTLREIYNVYPEQTFQFLTERYAEIDPRAWSAAIEKLDKTTRQELNQLRKQARSKAAGGA